MKKTTSEKLTRLYANGELTDKLSDTMRQVCEEFVAKEFYWLPQVVRENAAEASLFKIKCMLIRKETIRNLPGILQTICYRECCSQARKCSVVYRDPKTGLVSKNPDTGNLIRTARTISIDGVRNRPCSEEDSDNPNTVEIEIEDDVTTPAEVMDAKELLRKIDEELNRMPAKKAVAFRLVVYDGLSALEAAEVLFERRISISNRAERKKAQDSIAVLVNRVRRELLDKYRPEAVEAGILCQRRLSR